MEKSQRLENKGKGTRENSEEKLKIKFSHLQSVLWKNLKEMCLCILYSDKHYPAQNSQNSLGVGGHLGG